MFAYEYVENNDYRSLKENIKDIDYVIPNTYKPKYSNCLKHTAFTLACEYGYFECVKILVENNVDIMNRSNEFGFLGITFSILNHHHNIVEFLIQRYHEIDPELPLLVDAGNSDVKMFDLVYKTYDNILQEDEYGVNPYMISFELDHGYTTRHIRDILLEKYTINGVLDPEIKQMMIYSEKRYLNILKNEKLIKTMMKSVEKNIEKEKFRWMK